MAQEYYVCYWEDDNEPILVTPKNKELGIHFPVFDNPLDATRFGELYTDKCNFYVREVSIMFGMRTTELDEAGQ
jgi:hypothetical protein